LAVPGALDRRVLPVGNLARVYDLEGVRAAGGRSIRAALAGRTGQLVRIVTV